MDEADKRSLPPAIIPGATSLLQIWEACDDWTGVTTRADRKRKQNRLNQRAYRERRKLTKSDKGPVAEHCMNPTFATIEETLRNHEIQLQDNPYGNRSVTGVHGIERRAYLLPACPQKMATIRQLLQRAYEDYSLNTPKPTHLHVLIRLNVLNGLARNATAMGFPVEGLCRDDFVSPFNAAGPHTLESLKNTLSYPGVLCPTALQVAVKHHPWIDLLPFPGMRDNVLQGLVRGSLDEDELCADLLNVEDNSPGEKASLIIWGQSWEVRGWEASVAFLNKWGWLIRGCPGILEATNYWRKNRGEKILNFNDAL